MKNINTTLADLPQLHDIKSANSEALQHIRAMHLEQPFTEATFLEVKTRMIKKEVAVNVEIFNKNMDLDTSTGTNTLGNLLTIKNAMERIRNIDRSAYFEKYYVEVCQRINELKILQEHGKV